MKYKVHFISCLCLARSDKNDNKYEKRGFVNEKTAVLCMCSVCGNGVSLFTANAADSV